MLDSSDSHGYWGRKRRQDSAQDDNGPSKRRHVTRHDSAAGKPPASRKTFRVRHIPYWCSAKGALRNIIVHLFHLDKPDSVRVASIAPCPINPREFIATVSFEADPEALSTQDNNDQPRNEWRFEVPSLAEGSVCLTFDTHFLGFTPYHDQGDSSCTIDVVALSGLNGHAFGSFKERGGSFMWIRDSLPHDLPRVRIFTYGYDTSLLESRSFQTISDIGIAFRGALRTIRDASPSSNLERPLVLMGHSLGGIVVKEAIIQMAGEKVMEADATNLRSIVGILMFGAPSRGMAVESLLPMTRQNPNEALLQTLSTSSEMLRSQCEKFENALPFKDSKVFSFYETKQSPTASKEEGKWSMCGPHTVLVERESATHGRFPHEKEIPFIHPINETHSDMVKFKGPDDLTYLEVLSCLRNLHMSAQKVVQTRHQDITTEPFHNKERSYQQEACLESLAFVEQLQRQGEVITAKNNGTCTWVLEHPDYVKWLSECAGLLWVQGTPGAGKSTVIKFIVDDLETKSGDSTQIVASYFFHGRGTAMQKSAVGLYRSLLHQLLTKMPQYLAGLTERFEERCRQKGLPGQDWTWGEDELRDKIASIVLKASRGRPITLCVDALDECGSDAATSLVLYARNLVLQARNSGCHLRICFACRYYPSLNATKSNTICVEKQNSSDIRSILDTILQGFTDDSRIAIAGKISERANGVFQWAVLVASQALKLQFQGARRRVIQKHIEGIPVELHRLYAELLSKVPEDEHGLTLKLFQWLCFSQYPLTATQLRHVMAIDATMSHQSIAEYQDGDDFADDLDQLEIKVNHLSKGLVQIINNRAQFIHQSVSDYLLQCGLQNLQKKTMDDASCSEQKARGLAHFEISRSCIRYLTLREVLHYRFPESPRKQDRDQGFHAERVLDEAFPLARYAIFSIPWHIAQVEAEGISQQDLLGLFQWPSDEAIVGKWADLADVVDFLNNEWRFDWPVEGSRLIHLLCELGISSAFDHVLNSPEVEADGRLLDPEDAYHRTPLYYALIRNHDQIVQQLLNNEDVEIELLGPSSSSITSLHIAVERRDIPLIQQLLELGVDVDISDEDGKTPMAFALEREDIEIAKMLFAAGAGRNESYGPQGTIVHYAIRKENIGLLQHVLAGGVMVNSTDAHGRTPLFHAVVSNPNGRAMVQELLAAGADPQIADNKGETPLHYAVDTDDEGLLLSLVVSGDTTLRSRMFGESPLLRAAKLGNLRLVRLLLSNRFAPDIRDALGRKALKQAADRGHRAAVLSILRSNHIDPNDAFAMAISIHYFDFARDLLASGTLDLDPDDPREVPLHAAAISGEVDLVRMLLQDPRTNPNRRHHHDGKTALYMAVESRSLEVVTLLLDNVPEVNPDLPTFAGRTPLQEAARGKKLEMCKRLLCTGRVSAAPPPDRYNMTPLCAAAISGAVEIVQYLLSRDEIRQNAEEVERALGHARGFQGIGNAAREMAVALLNKAYYGIDIDQH